MKKISNKTIFIIDSITLAMILMFPLIPSRDHELFMTILFLTGIMTLISNISLIKINYENAISINKTMKIFLFIWAKLVIFSMLINMFVQTLYLDAAIGNPNSLNIYSRKAVIGWELMVNFYKWVLFYVPIIASANVLVFIVTTSLLMLFKNKAVTIMMNKLVKYLAKKINEIKQFFTSFNERIFKIIKTNRFNESISYLSDTKELFVNNKKAQVPPLFFC